jgi:linoleate 10R-lipoxygenase
MSQPDEQWTSAEFKKMFGDKTYDEVTPRDFVTVAAPLLVPPPNVRDWTFGGWALIPWIWQDGNGADEGRYRLKRDANGLFADNDIADIIQKAMMAPAAAFGARGTPEWLRVIGAQRRIITASQLI